jgi:adenylate cyclase
VQLIDAETDRHLWAERYDRELADIFAIQDEVTSSIVSIPPGRGGGGGRARRGPPRDAGPRAAQAAGKSRRL